MAVGPGKYDPILTRVREELRAEGVVLIVFNGKDGGGFSCQASLEMTRALPDILRSMADQMADDIARDVKDLTP